MCSLRSRSLSVVLLGKEVRCLLTGRALWVLLVILSLLTGYSFTQAVDLFSQASSTAMGYPELARGMSPLDGIFVPTFGALYLATTLLLPFVAIRAIGSDTQTGGLKLLLQSGAGLPRIVGAKTAALGLGWLLALIPALSAIGAWSLLGGHVYVPELANLLLGYTLYALVIAAVAFLAAAVTESSSTAAIVTLAVALGSWVLDFAGDTEGWLRHAAGLSLTAQLRVFEHGLFSASHAIGLLLAAATLLALSSIWLDPGRNVRGKALRSIAAVAVAAAIVLVGVAPLRLYADVSENRRNSFNPADERALRQMTEPLTITIHMSRQDSRLQEIERTILPVLRRTVPRLHVVYADTGGEGLFGAPSDEMYGLIVYEYDGKRDQSRSTGQGEILPLLHSLAGQTVSPDPVPDYPGYPLVADASALGIWFYVLLPALFGLLWWRNQHISKPKGGKSR